MKCRVALWEFLFSDVALLSYAATARTSRIIVDFIARLLAAWLFRMHQIPIVSLRFFAGTLYKQAFSNVLELNDLVTKANEPKGTAVRDFRDRVLVALACFHCKSFVL